MVWIRSNPCTPALEVTPYSPKYTKMSMEKSHWRLQPLYWPNQPSGKTWTDHYIQVANSTLWPASTSEVNWHHGLCTLRLQRSRTDGPPHSKGLSHPAETETPVMAAGWVTHQQAVGNNCGSKHGWLTAEEEGDHLTTRSSRWSTSKTATPWHDSFRWQPLGPTPLGLAICSLLKMPAFNNVTYRHSGQ